MTGSASARRGSASAVGLGVAALALGAAVAPQAVAQVGAVLPDAGEALRRATARPSPDAAPLPQGGEVRFTSQTPPANARDIRFVLNDVVLAGGQVYAPEDLRPVYADLLGREIDLTQAFGLAAALQARYRDDGYLFTRVIVPAQRIDDGVVRLEIVEAVITSVAVEEPGAPIGPVKALADEIVAPLNGLRNPRLEDIEAVLLLLNDIPGVIRAAAVPKIGEGERGAIDLFINMERAPFNLSAFYDNRQSPILGEGLIGAVASVNSWSPFADTTTLSLFRSAGFDDPFPDDFEERWTVQLEHGALLSPTGTRLSARALYSESAPGDNVADFDITGDQTELALELRQPLNRSRALRLDAYGGLTRSMINSLTPAAPIGTTGRVSQDLVVADRLYVLSAGLEMLQRDALGYTAGLAELRRGLGIGDASRAGDADLSRSDGDGEFWAIRAELERTLPVTDGVTFWVKGWGQASDRALLASEEMDIGGAELGRAYHPSEASGDMGAGIAAELRYGDEINWRGFSAPIEVYGYGDAAEVRNRASGAPRHATLISAGMGVRAQLPGRVAVNLEAAKPINEALAYDQSNGWRLLISASKDF